MTAGAIADVDLRLPADASAAGRARRTLDETSCVPPEVRDRFRLAVSEVVTNAVKHGVPHRVDPPGEEPAVELVVRVFPEVVRVEVMDPGPGFDQPEPGRAAAEALLIDPASQQESGWGLMLVEETTDRWGVERNDETTVWFEIDLPAGPGRSRGFGRG